MPASYSWDPFNLRFPWSDWPHLFLIVATPKFFDKILIYVNLYQYAKNQAVSISFGDMVDQKILQSDWLRTFCPISQEHKTNFPIYRICAGTQQMIIFLLKKFSKNWWPKFSVNSKNPVFGPFSQFGGEGEKGGGRGGRGQ